MRRLGVALLAAVAMLIAIGAFRAVPASAADGPTVSAVSPTSGPVSSGSTGQPPIARVTPYFPVSSETFGNNSIMINPVTVGDLVVLSMQLHTTGISITGITGGNVGNWHRAVAYTNTGTDTLYFEVWWGVATSAGPSTVNISYSANVSQWAIELIADSFTTASPPPWAVVTAGGSSNPSASSASWPALTSNGLADQLYWGASEEESSATSSPTVGFTSTVTGHGNCFVYDGALAPTKTYAPTCGQSPAAVSTAVGVIFSAGSGSGGGTNGTAVTITGSNFAAGDTVAFGGQAATGVTVNSATSVTATAPAGNSQKVGGTVDVTVTGPGGTSAVSPADEFTYLVSSGTYSISLAASGTAPAVGGVVTLTATANKDIGPTPYGMSIVDASTGAIVARAGSGSSFSVTVSQAAAMTQRYVAEIDNSGGVNIQANSSPVIVTWS
jgi:large repetitive protein